MNEPYYLADEKELFAKIFSMSDAITNKIKRTNKTDPTGEETFTTNSSKLDEPGMNEKPPAGGVRHIV